MIDQCVVPWTTLVKLKTPLELAQQAPVIIPNIEVNHTIVSNVTITPPENINVETPIGNNGLGNQSASTQNQTDTQLPVFPLAPPVDHSLTPTIPANPPTFEHPAWDNSTPNHIPSIPQLSPEIPRTPFDNSPLSFPNINQPNRPDPGHTPFDQPPFNIQPPFNNQPSFTFSQNNNQDNLNLSFPPPPRPF